MQDDMATFSSGDAFRLATQPSSEDPNGCFGDAKFKAATVRKSVDLHDYLDGVRECYLMSRNSGIEAGFRNPGIGHGANDRKHTARDEGEPTGEL